MAKKKKPNESEELELDQAFFDLTGYHTESPKKKSLVGAVIGTVCLLALVLAGCVIGIPFLLNDEPPATEPSTTATTPDPSTESTEAQAVVSADTVVLGVDLGGMTAQEASEALSAVFQEDMSVILNGEAYPVSTVDSISGFDAAGAADALLNTPQTFNLSDWLILDTDAIRDIADSYAVLHQQEGVATTCTVTGEMPTLEPTDEEPECQTLVIVKGKPSTAVDNEALYQAILQGFQNGVMTVEVPVATVLPEELDLQVVFDSYCVAPADAVMDMDSFQVTGGTYGYEFDLEQAQQLLENAEYGAIIEIPFYRTEPTVSAQSLQSLLFRDVLSSSSTPHTGDFNRNTNLKLACQAINGIVLYPGQEFSYNETLGKRTREKGYLPAASFMGEDTVDTVGGGICQVSSTLYYCTLLADLQVTYRAYHGFAVSYLPLGMDAMVSWGSYDYCFRNDSNYPIRIEAWVADGYVHIQLIGTDLRDYYVEMEYEVEAVYPYETVYRELAQNNPYGYEDGDVLVTPYTGYRVHTYRCLYDRQTKELIARNYEDYSDYWSRDEVIVKIVNTPE